MTVTRKGKLNGMAAKLENAQKRGLIESGMLVAQRATEMAPIDTGRLKRSITQGNPKNDGKGRLSIDVGSNVVYAPFQEFGTRRMKAQPYLRPALEKSRDDIVKLITSNIMAAFDG